MASSLELQSVDIYITDASQIQHLPAIIAAAGLKKVNVYFSAASTPGDAEATETSSGAREWKTREVGPVDSTTETSSVSKVSFNDLPLEMQINIFKLIFIHDTPQSFRVGSEQYGEPAKTRGRVVHFPNLSMQLLRVSKVWKQYGNSMILENTFSIITSCTTKWALHRDLNEGAQRFFKSLKHLSLPSYYYNLSQARNLKRFENLHSVQLQPLDYYATIVPGSNVSSGDPVKISKAKLVQRLPGVFDVKFLTLLRDSLLTVKYTHTNKYECFKQQDGCDRERQVRKLVLEVILSGQTATGYDIEVVSDIIEEDWTVVGEEKAW